MPRTFYVLTIPPRGSGVFGRDEETYLACARCCEAALRQDPTGGASAHPAVPGTATCELHYEGLCQA